MPYSLKGKIALVTGSARGIGKSILQTLAENECEVILHYLKFSESIKNTIKKFKSRGMKITAYQADLTHELEVKDMFNKIKNKHKNLHILVNNVGDYLKKSLDKLTTKEWHEIIDSNLNSSFYCTHCALPLLRKSKSGRIINIGYASIGQIIAKPKILPYQIAKTGLLLLTKAYAQTEAKNKILVNMISPGVMENSIHSPKKEIPLKRRGSLKGLAQLVIQTIESDYITGAHIEYSGGFNL